MKVFVTNIDIKVRVLRSVIFVQKRFAFDFSFR